MEKLESFRKSINSIDKQITKLLLKRFWIAKNISLYKEKSRIAVRDSKREAQVLKNIEEFSGKDKFIIGIFKKIISHSRNIQKWKK